MSKIKNYGTGLGVGLGVGGLAAGMIVLIYEEVKYQMFRKQRIQELAQEYPECQAGKIFLGYAGIGGQYVDGIVCPGNQTLQNNLNQQLNAWAVAQVKKNLKTYWPALVLPAMLIITLMILSCCWCRSTAEQEDEKSALLPKKNSSTSNNIGRQLLGWLQAKTANEDDTRLLIDEENVSAIQERQDKEVSFPTPSPSRRL